ncbi:hypothetical protein MA16_Dca025388 [Dendrobium catenatum]|uniref:Uncharacterized protein n=1 Tax=Dendrobium catenatum TaxID=906689 RepID=A0A2I0VHI2_9ASPA|nr:hypothetical protein MA16_Dca025388 [Dendrobium catenatum]
MKGTKERLGLKFSEPTQHKRKSKRNIENVAIYVIRLQPYIYSWKRTDDVIHFSRSKKYGI